MILFLKLATAMFVPCFLGFSIIIHLFKKERYPLLFLLSISFGLGLGLLSLYIFILDITKIPLTLYNIALPLLILSIINSSTFLISQRISTPLKIPPYSLHIAIENNFIAYLFSFIVISFILFHVYFVFWRNFSFPIVTWDAYATIAFKAKIFYFDGSLENINNVPHASYPLHVPLLLYWIALNIGEWSDIWIKLFSPFYLLSFLYLIYYFLRHWTNKIGALCGVALPLTSLLYLATTYLCLRDFPLSYYNCLAVMLILLWHKNKSNAFLIIAGLFSGIATFVKLEAIAYPAIHLFLLFSLSARNSQRPKSILKDFIYFLIPCLLTAAPYITHKFLTQTPSSGRFQLNLPTDIFTRIPVFFTHFTKQLFFSSNWSLIWFLLVISILTNYKKLKNPEVQTLLLGLIAFFGLWFTVSLFTPNYYSLLENTTGIYNDIPRLISHFFPLATLLIIFLNFKLNK